MSKNSLLRFFFGYLKKFYKSQKIKFKIKRRLKYFGNKTETFGVTKFSNNILRFINSNQIGQEHFLFRFSKSSNFSTLYASAYALMTLHLLGEIKNYSKKQKEEWVLYFDSFQNEWDGLFYDQKIRNDIFDNSDWWGARHLSLHMISAYTCLGYHPKYQFKFLKNYYEPSFIEEWLNEFDWFDDSIGNGDLDNKIMNIGCLLQYQRDFWNDSQAGSAVELLKLFLRKKINKQTGMWGGFDLNNKSQRSRMVQFAYHLFQIYFYDNDFNFNHEKIVNIVLKTKNNVDGFGAELNSSACEDIDSIDLLIRFEPLLSLELSSKVRDTISKGFRWVLSNQVSDGGFVFKLEEDFQYGNIETSSKKNEGGMMPTWFRTLSIVYIANFLGIENKFQVQRCPGYEY